jgi:hypothetical protein
LHVTRLVVLIRSETGQKTHKDLTVVNVLLQNFLCIHAMEDGETLTNRQGFVCKQRFILFKRGLEARRHQTF